MCAYRFYVCQNKTIVSYNFQNFTIFMFFKKIYRISGCGYTRWEQRLEGLLLIAKTYKIKV